MPNQGKVEQGIKQFVDQFDMDKLFLINYQHSFIKSIMNEPVIKKLGFQIHCILGYFMFKLI